MTKTILQKMQLKDEAPLLVVGAPDDVAESLMAGFEDRDVKKSFRSKGPFGFVLVFVQACVDIETLAPKATERLAPDGLLWFAYPKKSSKRYTSDIGRDDSWSALGDLGFEGVRQVAIDEDWSALRFRHVDQIKTMKRDPKRAMTEKGKARTQR